MAFWKRGGEDELEAQLRTARPEPRPEFTRAIADRVRPRTSPVKRGSRRLSVLLAAGLSALVLTPVAASAFHIPFVPHLPGVPDAATIVASFVNIGADNDAPTVSQYQCPVDPLTVFVLGQVGEVDILQLVRAQLPVVAGIEVISFTQVGDQIEVLVCIAV